MNNPELINEYLKEYLRIHTTAIFNDLDINSMMEHYGDEEDKLEVILNEDPDELNEFIKIHKNYDYHIKLIDANSDMNKVVFEEHHTHALIINANESTFFRRINIDDYDTNIAFIESNGYVFKHGLWTRGGFERFIRNNKNWYAYKTEDDITDVVVIPNILYMKLTNAGKLTKLKVYQFDEICKDIPYILTAIGGLSEIQEDRIRIYIIQEKYQ